MNNILESIREKRRNLSENNVASPNSITDVIIILGSSRSGSSLLHKLISDHPEINSLPGEEQTYFNLLYAPNHSNDDRFKNVNVNFTTLAEEIMFDVGSISEAITNSELKRRLLVQWPKLINNFDFLNDTNCSSLNESIEKFKLPLSFYENHLSEHLDLGHDHILIEEPPFLTPATIKKFKQRKKNILVLKSSSNAYRMDLMLSLFPNAKYHYVLIKRDYQQVINGLYDGWKSSGFHSHSFLNQLSIKDYQSNTWWKFDLPPNWKSYISSNLMEISAFQWRSSYSYILNFLKNKQYFTFHYNDFFNPQLSNNKLNQFFKQFDLCPHYFSELPMKMSTFPPNIDRWKEKIDIITPILNQKENLEFNNEINNF